jgi:hypothetical protein
MAIKVKSEWESGLNKISIKWVNYCMYLIIIKHNNKTMKGKNHENKSDDSDDDPSEASN